MDSLADLRCELSEVALLKQQFQHEQRLLLIGGCDLSMHLDENEMDVQAAASIKRRSQVHLGKRPNPVGLSSSMIHPSVRDLFNDMKHRYQQLESSALRLKANETNEQKRQELHKFIEEIVLSSWITLLHVPLVLNATAATKPDVVICALAGHESGILGKSKRNFLGNEKFVPTCTAHLVKEDIARSAMPQTTSWFRESKIYLEYATQATGKLQEGTPVTLEWKEENDTTDPTINGIFWARLYNITPNKRDKKSQIIWKDGYHLAFYTHIHSSNKSLEHFVGLTLPFEIVSNLSRLKEGRLGDSLWRLMVCTEDKTFTTVPQQSVDQQIHIETLLQELNRWFKGYVGTSIGLNKVHMMNLRRLLDKPWGCFNGNVDYSTFENTLWPYFFNATEFIRKNRDTLWKDNLMNYCFASSSEAEALLSQKETHTFLIRFQLTSKPPGLPTISLIVRGERHCIAHVDVKALTSDKAKTYDLPHFLKYSVLYYEPVKNTVIYLDKLTFSDFEVYGRGKFDVTKYAPDNPNIATMMDIETCRDPNGALVSYSGKRKVCYSIKIVPVEDSDLRDRLARLYFSPLGTVLSSNGIRQNLEWLPHEIQSIDVTNLQRHTLQPRFIPDHFSQVSDSEESEMVFDPVQQEGSITVGLGPNHQLTQSSPVFLTSPCFMEEDTQSPPHDQTAYGQNATMIQDTGYTHYDETGMTQSWRGQAESNHTFSQNRFPTTTIHQLHQAGPQRAQSSQPISPVLSVGDISPELCNLEQFPAENPYYHASPAAGKIMQQQYQQHHDPQFHPSRQAYNQLPHHFGAPQMIHCQSQQQQHPGGHNVGYPSSQNSVMFSQQQTTATASERTRGTCQFQQQNFGTCTVPKDQALQRPQDDQGGLYGTCMDGPAGSDRFPTPNLHHHDGQGFSSATYGQAQQNPPQVMQMTADNPQFRQIITALMEQQETIRRLTEELKLGQSKSQTE